MLFILNHIILSIFENQRKHLYEIKQCCPEIDSTVPEECMHASKLEYFFPQNDEDYHIHFF